MSASVEPLTPMLQTALSWEDCLTTPPPPSMMAPSPPVGRRVPRKPLPAHRQNSPEIKLQPSPVNNFVERTRPVDPLRVFAKGDPQYMQCMVCRKPALVTSAAELVCSHYAHLRCLHQHTSSWARRSPGVSKEEYPPCQVCKYPAKPKDAILSQGVRSLVQPPVEISRPLTPPPRTPRIRSGESHLAARPASITSSIYSTDEGFKAFDTKVPLRLSATAVSKSHSIGQIDEECQFLVSVSCPDYTYSTTPHVSTPLDLVYSHQTTERLSRQLGLPHSEIGRLRMERTVEFSADGLNWAPAKIMLCEFIVVVMAPHASSPMMLADIEQSLKGLALVTRAGVSMAVQFNFTSQDQPPAYITSSNRDQLFSLVAAINDSSLQFPLAKSDTQLLLQSPFGSDYVFTPPCHTVICLPDSLPVGIISEAVGRMRTFEKIGIVRYGQDISTFALERQAYGGWEDLLARPANFASGSQSLETIISAATNLFDHSLASRSIVLVSRSKASFGGVLGNIPIYTVGVGHHSPAVLSMISGQTCGSYVYSPTDQLSQYIANLTFAERTLSHENVEVRLKPRQQNASISSVSGFGFAPGDNSSKISEDRHGQFVVQIGRLRAGQRQSFVVGAEIESQVFKYAVEDSQAELIEVLATATMVPGGTPITERSIARTGLDFAIEAGPSSYSRMLKMHQASPIHVSNNVYTIGDRIALSTALSLDILSKHIERHELEKAAAVAQSIERGLEATSLELPSMSIDTKAATEAFLDVGLLIEVLLAEIRNIHVSIDESYVQSVVYQVKWLLRSRRSFSRRTNLEIIYFNSNLMNAL